MVSIRVRGKPKATTYGHRVHILSVRYTWIYAIQLCLRVKEDWWSLSSGSLYSVQTTQEGDLRRFFVCPKEDVEWPKTAEVEKKTESNLNNINSDEEDVVSEEEMDSSLDQILEEMSETEVEEIDYDNDTTLWSKLPLLDLNANSKTI